MIGAIPVLDAGHEFIRGTGLARPFQICLEHFLRVFQLVAGMELAKMASTESMGTALTVTFSPSSS